MKITTEIEYDVTIKAVLRDDELKLSLSVAAPYGNERKATATVSEFSDGVRERVQKALAAAAKEQLDNAVGKATNAASVARLVAAERGEL